LYNRTRDLIDEHDPEGRIQFNEREVYEINKFPVGMVMFSVCIGVGSLIFMPGALAMVGLGGSGVSGMAWGTKIITYTIVKDDY